MKVKEMILALLKESELVLSDEMIEVIIEKVNKWFGRWYI